MSVNQLKAGAFLSYFLIGLNTLVGLTYTPYMLRMIGQSEYGLYSLVASFIAYLTIFDFGFGNAIIRYTSKFRAEKKEQEQYETFGMFLILYSLIGIVSFFVGLLLYGNIDNMFAATMTPEEIEKARIMLLILLFNLAFTFPFTLFGSIITAYEDFVFQKVVNITRVILQVVVMVIVLECGYKAIGMVVVVTVFNMLTLLLNAFYCKYKIGIKIYFHKFNWFFLKEVSIYSFWIFLNVIMDKIYWSTGQFVLGAFVGTAAVAVFAIAIQLESMYMQFSTAISSLFLPKVTTMVANRTSKKEISEIFIRTGRIQYIVMAFILTGFIVFGRQFILLWAGKEYLESYYLSLLFFTTLTIPLIQNMGITILQARNEMKFRSLLYVFIALLSLVLQIFLAKRFGSFGVAFSIVFALVLGQIIIMNIYYSKKQDIQILLFWKEIAKMSLVPILIGTGSFFLFKYYVLLETVGDLFLGILFFSSIYIPFFWFFSMNKNEQDLVISLFRKKIRKRDSN